MRVEISLVEVDRCAGFDGLSDMSESLIIIFKGTLRGKVQPADGSRGHKPHAILLKDNAFGDAAQGKGRSGPRSSKVIDITIQWELRSVEEVEGHADNEVELVRLHFDKSGHDGVQREIVRTHGQPEHRCAEGEYRGEK
jgi:hypothetical protein